MAAGMVPAPVEGGGGKNGHPITLQQEFMPIAAACNIWGPTGTSNRCLCDNMTVVQVITAQCSKDCSLMRLGFFAFVWSGEDDHTFS